MASDRITYYRGIIIIKDVRPDYPVTESYKIIINGIKSTVSLTTLQAAQNVIDTHLKNK